MENVILYELKLTLKLLKMSWNGSRKNENEKRRREALFRFFLVKLLYPGKYIPNAIMEILESLQTLGGPLQILGSPLQTLGTLQFLGLLVQTQGSLLQTLGVPPSPSLQKLHRIVGACFYFEKKLVLCTLKLPKADRRGWSRKGGDVYLLNVRALQSQFWINTQYIKKKMEV